MWGFNPQAYLQATERPEELGSSQDSMRYFSFKLLCSKLETGYYLESIKAKYTC